MKKIITTLLLLFIFFTVSAQKGTIKVKKQQIAVDCNFEFTYQPGLINKKIILKEIYSEGHPEIAKMVIADSTFTIGKEYPITKASFQDYLSKYCDLGKFKLKTVQINDATEFYDKEKSFILLIGFENAQ